MVKVGDVVYHKLLKTKYELVCFENGIWTCRILDPFRFNSFQGEFVSNFESELSKKPIWDETPTVFI